VITVHPIAAGGAGDSTAVSPAPPTTRIVPMHTSKEVHEMYPDHVRLLQHASCLRGLYTPLFTIIIVAHYITLHKKLFRVAYSLKTSKPLNSAQMNQN